MAGTGRRWLVGCGSGCAAVVLLGIVVTVGGGFLMMRPFNRAAESQRELAGAHGMREDFRPGPEAFRPERIQAFLAVRRELMPLCENFARLTARFEAVEQLDQGQQDVSAGEAVRTVLPVIGSVFGIAGDIGRHVEARNRALLAQDMGLGEYVWYYVLAYNSWLGHEPNQEFDDGDADGAYATGERRAIAALLTNHAAALRAAGRAAEAEVWATEAEAVMDAQAGVPFGLGGLPAEAAAALEPWRDQLEAQYCAATSSFELGAVRKQGLSFHSD